MHKEEECHTSLLEITLKSLDLKISTSGQAYFYNAFITRYLPSSVRLKISEILCFIHKLHNF